MRYVRILSVETERDVAILDVGDEIGPHFGGYILTEKTTNAKSQSKEQCDLFQYLKDS